MGKKFEALTDTQIEFIQKQKLFFVGTAGKEGRVNISPKGMDSFRVIDKNKIAWLSVTGSGNETAAHVLENGRMTIMFAAFDEQPMILRLYGKANVFHTHDKQWAEKSAVFPNLPGARQVYELEVDLVQTSCGFGVPLYEYKGERETLLKWADKKGESGIQEYWQQKNTETIDGNPTFILGKK